MKSTGLAILCVLVGLLIGGIFVYAAFPRTKEVIVTNEVPIEVPVEKIVNVEVPIDYKQSVIDALNEGVLNGDYRKCDSVKYDSDEISVKKVYDGFVLTESSSGDQIISDVKLKLSYDGKCYKTLTCSLDEEQELTC